MRFGRESFRKTGKWETTANPNAKNKSSVDFNVNNPYFALRR